jgi:alkylation response protein AidB-like acyl-CoA dehydrogenase
MPRSVWNQLGENGFLCVDASVPMCKIYGAAISEWQEIAVDNAQKPARADSSTILHRNTTNGNAKELCLALSGINWAKMAFCVWMFQCKIYGAAISEWQEIAVDNAQKPARADSSTNINDIGTEEQKQYWLPKMVTGEVVGAIGMTEPGAGSDCQ